MNFCEPCHGVMRTIAGTWNAASSEVIIFILSSSLNIILPFIFYHITLMFIFTSIWPREAGGGH